MLKALQGLPPWLRPLLWLGFVGYVITAALGVIAIWVGARNAPWWWNALGLPTGESEDNGNGSDDENGDDADPEEENGELTGGRPGDPDGDGGGQVPFDVNLVAVGSATLAEAKLQQQAAADALARSQSR